MGYFNADADEVRTEWLKNHDGDDHAMRLLDNLIYVDDKTNRWTAPKGSIIDGASIPRFLWSFIGSPFTGDYRRASIIHDVYCENKEETWQNTHKVFREIMLHDGVSKWKARLMFWAVWRFGPRWKKPNLSSYGQ